MRSETRSIFFCRAVWLLDWVGWQDGDDSAEGNVIEVGFVEETHTQVCYVRQKNSKGYKENTRCFLREKVIEGML